MNSPTLIFVSMGINLTKKRLKMAFFFEKAFVEGRTGRKKWRGGGGGDSSTVHEREKLRIKDHG